LGGYPPSIFQYVRNFYDIETQYHKGYIENENENQFQNANEEKKLPLDVLYTYKDVYTGHPAGGFKTAGIDYRLQTTDYRLQATNTV
jgi:hypothetical protein